MFAHAVQIKADARRGTVMIMVVGVLAMLFIIGSTLLIVGRFERVTVQITERTKSMNAVTQGVVAPVIDAPRSDLLGSDDKAYNRAWPGIPGGDYGPGADYGDYPGRGSNRDGDPFLSSLEPYQTTCCWNLFAASSLSDTQGGYRDLDIKLTANPIEGVGASARADADGDGVQDTVPITIQGFNDSFGGSFNMGLRVIPHSGMVWLNRMTHPTLLAQVIHPRDIDKGAIEAKDISAAEVEALRTYIEQNLALGPTDENDLRRRFMLPPLLPTPDPGKNYFDVAPPLVRKLPITTGYSDPTKPIDDWMSTTAGRGPVNQWFMFQPGQEADWQRLIKPGPAMTESGYNARADTYDRRRLLTVDTSDDALRPQRDEQRLATIPWPTDPAYFPFKDFYNVLNPNGVTQPLAYGVMDYGIYGTTTHDYQHVFNTDGLRTQFSLRDVLEPSWDGSVWTGKASYRRAMQLTAYFLAMIQHTSVPGSNLPNPPSQPQNPTTAELAEQLRTAMQLAVNTIDFADDDGHLDDDDGDTVIGSANDIPDQVSTCLSYDLDGAGLMPPITVCGVEKQPFITEAYVKRIKFGEDRGTGVKWQDTDKTTNKTYSIYAVELYNPYDVTLDLTGYVLQTESGATNEIDLGTLVGWLAPQSYVVIANRQDDPTPPANNPFISAPGLTVTVATAPTQGANLFIKDTLEISAANPIRLLRKNTEDGNNQNDRLAQLDPSIPTGLLFPADFYPADPTKSAEIEVDRMDLTDIGSLAGVGADRGYWAIDADALLAKNQEPASAPVANKWLVRDSSLQRHKDLTPNVVNPAMYPPVYWHFTLSRQMLFPLPWYEHPVNPARATTPPTLLPNVIDASTNPPRPDQHNLLNSGTFVGPDGLTNAQLVAREFAGLALDYNTTVPQNAVFPATVLGYPSIIANHAPIAAFPVVTADRGIHPSTLGTMAFPTTGTLLLITRYGQLAKSDPDLARVGQDLPITVAATRQLIGITHSDFAAAQQDLGQICQLDNGHLPVFDAGDPAIPADGQKCLDGNNSRFNGLPWGQLVFEYFTALPFEELARDVDPFTTGIQGRMMDSAPGDYRKEYRALNGQYNDSTPLQNVRFADYPVVMPVSQATSPLGPRVQGRINIGVGPWWVLDGLPVLPDAVLGHPNNTIPPGSYRLLAGLPVPEIEAQRLDPPDKSWDSMAGAWFVHDLIDEKYFNLNTAPLPYHHPTLPSRNTLPEIPPAGMPSISPKLAQYMVSYREERAIGAIDAIMRDLNNQPIGQIGFATTGELCNVVRKVRFDFNVAVGSNTLTTPNLDELRVAVDATAGTRPYSYLGYLQLVTPIVRMEDWTTVKNHVYTIYATIQSTGQPPVAVRTQVTIDRTRCLYNPADLPERITETPPISYYNAVDD